jgi:hypothetical protein
MKKQKNIFFYFLIIGSICMMIYSCNIINPAETIPSYIKIDKIDFSVSPGQGTVSSNITDAWVYIDDQPMGCYPLPAKFPVLQEGSHKISIYAGITVNGIAGARSVCPFYKPWTQTVNLVKDSVVELHPATTYYDETKFSFIEDFEDGGLLFEKSPLSDTMIIQSLPSEAFEGTYSGIITLDNTIDTFECKTIFSYVLPKASSPVFVEMNYKTNNEFTVGIYSNLSGYSIRAGVLVVNPSSTWRKIYINLTGAVSRENTAIDTKIFIAANKASDVSNGVILLDNIKLIHK